MAEIAHTRSKDETFGNDIRILTWTPLAKGDTGQPFRMPGWADRSVQIQGDFDGATVLFEGSNDGTNYFPLTDPQGNAISKTSESLEAVTEMTLWVRPRVSGSGGTTAITVILAVRRQ